MNISLEVIYLWSNHKRKSVETWQLHGDCWTIHFLKVSEQLKHQWRNSTHPRIKYKWKYNFPGSLRSKGSFKVAYTVDYLNNWIYEETSKMSLEGHLSHTFSEKSLQDLSKDLCHFEMKKWFVCFWLIIVAIIFNMA